VRLVAALTGKRTIGWLAVLLLFFPQEVAGGIATFDVAVEERFIAFALVLASLVLLTRGREVAAGLIAGLAGDIHLVTLANFLVAVACLFGVEFARSEPRRARVFSAGRFLGAMFVALLPVLALKLRSDSIGSPAWIDPAWLRMILLRSSHHFLPDFRLFGSHLLLGSALLALAWRWQAERWLLSVLAAALLSMIAGFALATLFATRLPWLLGLQLSLFRTDQLFMVVAAVATAWVFDRVSSRRPELALFALVVFSFCALRERIGVLGGLALIAGVTPWRPGPADPGRRPLRGGHMVAGLALFLVIAIVRGHRPHWDNPLRPADSPSIEVQYWLRTHTGRDALVLAPPGETDFRIYSERAVLGSWKDWTYNVLSRGFAFEMYRRLRDVGGISLATCATEADCERACVEHYARLSEGDILKLAGTYGLDYVVRPAGAPLAWRPVFENSAYLVYAIAPHASPDASGSGARR